MLSVIHHVWFIVLWTLTSYILPSCHVSHVCPQAVDLSKPIDKRIYKGTQPTCHDFNQYSATAESVALIVGFSAGQVQYLDPIKKETSKLFNEEVFLHWHEVLPMVPGNMGFNLVFYKY